jgi:hypothetical protein
MLAVSAGEDPPQSDGEDAVLSVAMSVGSIGLLVPNEDA